MEQKQTNQDLENLWNSSVERAAQETEHVQELGKQLTEGAGLHVKSDVQASGLWGTTRCGCESYSCDVIC